MSDETRDEKGRFQPGQSGNPRGRTKGARNKFTDAFLKAMLADFETHGVEAIQQVRENSPGTYLRVAASILPKQLTDEDGNMPAAYIVVPARGAESVEGVEIIDAD
jgi:hypothetical protein